MSKYEGVHSCGPNCTQPLCVANRRIEELTADRDDIRRKYIAEAKETDRLQTKAEELEEQVQGYAKNAAFYRSCALSGEVPINDDAIPYNPPRGGE